MMRELQKSNLYELFGKRYLDLTLAALALLVLIPFLLLIAIAVRYSLGPPVLFRQQRPGLFGKPFTLFKFRSMADSVDVKGHVQSDAERLSGLGNLLRRSSLDELPSLWNVVRGEMSLVGPRPLLMKYLERYSPKQMRRHEVRPGVTGWAQVNGRNALTWEQKFELDVWYVENLSLFLDLRIMLTTLWKTIRREGINQIGHATAQEFEGTTHRHHG